MATSVATPVVLDLTALNINTQPEYTFVRKDVAYGLETGKDGKKTPVVFNDVDEAKKAEEAGMFEGTVVSTVVKLPVNFAAVLEYAKATYLDDEGKARDINEVLNDLVTLFRPGMQVKATNRRNQRLLEQDDSGNFKFSDADLTDGVLDLTADITSPSKRTFLTEEQKMWKSLSGLAAGVRDNMWKVYLQSINKEFYIPANVE